MTLVNALAAAQREAERAGCWMVVITLGGAYISMSRFDWREGGYPGTLVAMFDDKGNEVEL